MKPKPIRTFSALQLASLALVIVNNLVYWDFNMELFRGDSDAGGPGIAVFYLSTGIGILVALLMWFLVLWKRSNFARWFLVVLCLAGLAGVARAISVAPVGMVSMTVGALGLQAAAVCFLFRSDAAPWFRQRTEHSTQE